MIKLKMFEHSTPSCPMLPEGKLTVVTRPIALIQVERPPLGSVSEVGMLRRGTGTVRNVGHGTGKTRRAPNPNIQLLKRFRI